MFQIQNSEVPDWEQSIMKLGYSDEMPLETTHVPAIGGDMGTENSDFEVSEIPAYMPCGTGDHVYLWIEKSGKNTQDVSKALERLFEVKEIDVGCAGKKDAHAITRQWFSVQTNKDPVPIIEQLNGLGWLKVLEHSRHTNKLRMGHLRGNRFNVKLYGVSANDDQISEALTALQLRGFINYFGKQRFGFDGSNVAHGIHLLAGGRAKHQMQKLYISALQSAIFNLTAARRYKDNGFAIQYGDVLQKINAGCFVCEEPEVDQRRADEGEVAITLGLPGKRVMHGHHYTEEMEQAALADILKAWECSDGREEPYDPSLISKYADGTRRVFCVRPDHLSYKKLSENSISVEFALPSGSYATVFLRHLCGSSFTR